MRAQQTFSINMFLTKLLQLSDRSGAAAAAANLQELSLCSLLGTAKTLYVVLLNQQGNIRMVKVIISFLRLCSSKIGIRS